MRPTQYPSQTAVTLLRRQKIASLPELMAALGTDARRTVCRKLKELACRTSYSHGGRYYTLDDIPQFDAQGLWSHRDVWFSVYGTLLETAAALVQASESGYFVEELDHAVHVGTKDALRKLVASARLGREPVAGRFWYCAPDSERRRRQLLARRTRLAAPALSAPLPEAAILPEELRTAIVLFFGSLDEKHRRLYAGLEALKTGRGGDVRIAELLDLDVGTVARGRRELLAQDVEVERIRRTGGGRQRVEKKPRKSSPASKR
jgi:hypothetical protein